MRNDFRLNAYREGAQRGGDIAALAGGGFVAVWGDSRQESDSVWGDYGVYARIFDGDGRPLGREFRVNQNIEGDQMLPEVAALPGGGFVVAWVNDGPDASGVTDPYSEGNARVFNADGTARTPVIQITPSLEEDHAIQAVETLADGTALILTSNSPYSTDWEINAVRMDGRGRQAGERVTIDRAIDSGIAGGSNVSPTIDVAATRSGGYMMSWREFPPLETDRRVYARPFEKDGDPDGRERQVSETAEGLDRGGAHLAALPGGRFAIAYTGEDRRHDTEVYFRILDARGRPETDARRVNGPDRDGNQHATDVTHLGGGMTLVTFASLDPASEFPFDFLYLKGRLYDAEGAPVSDPFAITGQSYLDMGGGTTEVMANGKLVTGWHAGPSVGEDSFARVWDLGARLDGGRRDDVIRGGLLAERIAGKGGDDRLYGDAGDDRLYGGEGRDRLYGGAADDRLFGGKGRDVLVGGAGEDRLWGGGSADVFVFRPGDGRDAILDFGRGDRIDLGAHDLGRREARDAIERRGDDVAIDLGGGDVIRIEDARPSAVEDALLL